MLTSLDYKIAVPILIIGAAFFSQFVRWSIGKVLKKESGKLKIDPTRFKFLKNATAFIIWMAVIICIIYMVPSLRKIALTLFAGAGIFVAIIGFAAQQAFSNIIGGIFIVIFKPFRVGDLIKIGEQHHGFVEDITLRHTVINDFQNKRIIIPNSTIGAETVVNESISEMKICKWIEIGISYDSPLEHAIEVLRKIVEDHPSCMDNRTTQEIVDNEPIVEVRLIRYEDSAMVLRAYAWCQSSEKSWKMTSDINRTIKKRFDEENIHIPFPHRTVILKQETPKA